MVNRRIFRGDSYALRRPLFTHVLAGIDGAPFLLSGSTVRTTFRPAVVPPEDDPTDALAPIRGTLIVNADGVPTTSDKLHLVGGAAGGTVELRLTRAETLALPLATPLISDVELTDAAGEVFTFVFEDTLETRDGLTHRTEG